MSKYYMRLDTEGSERTLTVTDDPIGCFPYTTHAKLTEGDVALFYEERLIQIASEEEMNIVTDTLVMVDCRNFFTAVIKTLN